MTQWIKRGIWGALAGTLVLGGLVGCGHQGHAQGWGMSDERVAEIREKMVDKVGRKLDLNEAQKAKLGVLADRLKEQRQALMTPGSDPRAEWQSLVAGSQFDRAKAQRLVQEKTAAVQTKSPEVIQALGDFYDSLNPEQQTKVREFMQHRRGGWFRG